jgi:hypothetical protein
MKMLKWKCWLAAFALAAGGASAQTEVAEV